MYRQNGEDLCRAITLSLPEELYNYGEFTLINPLFINWYKHILNLSDKARKDGLQFITVHLGSTESHHFAAAVAGLEDYCKALNTKLDAKLLYECNHKLLHDMAAYFKQLMLSLVAAH